MLNGSAVARCDEPNIGNLENNNPISDEGNTNKARQAVLKKGGKKLRPPHHHKAPRNSPNVRLTDNNNNRSLTAPSATQPGTELPAGTGTGADTVLTLHHLRHGARKELLKPKDGRLERGVVQPGGQPTQHNVAGHDQISQNVNVRSHRQGQSSAAPPPPSHAAKKKDNRSPSKRPSLHPPALREQKQPLQASNNVKIPNIMPSDAALEYLKDGEKVYAGAKFSEPPSPSVLPKPPSHWVGENEPRHSNQSREQMTVHLKSLLKVPDTA